jgi:thiol-disulfide isomerase/thioredoxin
MNGKWLANLDMYRKVPGDLTEQSQQGSMVSWVAVLAMAILFVRETQQFLTPHLVTDLSLDKTNSLSKIKANFNITMMDLACEFATVNVVSVLGNEQNITKDIQRWPVDALNNKHAVDVKHNDEQHHDVVMHDVGVTESLEKLHENGEDAVSLDEENFLFAMEDHEFVFVDFFAGWCSHCQALAPTWERFAEVMHDVEDAVDPRFIQDYTPEEYERAKRLKFPVLVAKVDCVAHHDFCAKQRIRAYPTLTLFVDGERYKVGLCV